MRSSQPLAKQFSKFPLMSGTKTKAYASECTVIGTLSDLSGDNCDLGQSDVTEETPEGEEHPVADTENKEDGVEEAEEEGPKEMTLEEWTAMQNKDRAKVEFNIRKPNERTMGKGICSA
ncbi:hypothetical protein STEG23_009354 [Scotinomys teguina]